MRPFRFRPPPIRLIASMAAFGSIAAAACGESRASLPVTVLAAGSDTLHVPGAEVTQAGWLGGHRWAVILPQNSALDVVDFAAKAVVPLAAAAPKELQHPATLFSAGDTLLVNDWGLRRTTVWAPDGKLLRAIPASDVTAGALPRAIDAAGRLYYEIAPPARADGSGNRDSAAIVRVAPGASRTDTVTRLGPLDLAEVQSDAGSRFERRVFSGEDRWGVLADGSVWVARVYPNRVDWIGPDGKVTRGAQLPDRILEVTRTDRELFVRRFPAELRSTVEQLPFAAVKPPFENAFAGPGATVWLEKSQAVTDSARGYQVVGRDGKPVREVRVHGYWSRILAASDGAALVSDPDSTGYRLSESALPAAR
jgi:hypothetical protein